MWSSLVKYAAFWLLVGGTGYLAFNALVAPKVARADELGSAVVYRMETHGIIAMPVLDGDNRVVGVIHLHDLMRAGVV